MKGPWFEIESCRVREKESELDGKGIGITLDGTCKGSGQDDQ